MCDTNWNPRMFAFRVRVCTFWNLCCSYRVFADKSTCCMVTTGDYSSLIATKAITGRVLVQHALQQISPRNCQQPLANHLENKVLARWLLTRYRPVYSTLNEWVSWWLLVELLFFSDSLNFSLAVLYNGYHHLVFKNTWGVKYAWPLPQNNLSYI